MSIYIRAYRETVLSLVEGGGRPRKIKNRARCLFREGGKEGRRYIKNLYKKCLMEILRNRISLIYD